ncbi:hypothetical protein D049_3788B, partial [Vibrio parahaemolyticus VPTS-2010]
GSRL